jgi:hypothetical protein
LNTLSTLFLEISIKRFEVVFSRRNIFFETFLAITSIVTMAMVPVSGQSPPTPTQVVPSVQDYLQITAATVTNQTGGQLMNAQISTMGEIPAAFDDEDGEEGGTGFGYGILSTGPSNMITVTTDMGLEQEEVTLPQTGALTNLDQSSANVENVASSNGLELHFVEMTPMISQQCVGKGDYEVKINATEQSPRFNPGYPLEVGSRSITVGDIRAADLGSDIDSVVSFTVVPVYDELGGEEEEGDDDEDTGDQPSNICIHIIGRAGVT